MIGIGHARTLRDLTWYYHRDWEGEMGLRSTMIARLESCGSGGVCHPDPTDSQVDAATRFRLIRRRVLALRDCDRRVLCAAHSPRSSGPDGTEGVLGALLLVSPQSRDAAPTPQVWALWTSRSWLAGHATPDERRVVESAIARYSAAVRAFEGA